MKAKCKCCLCRESEKAISYKSEYRKSTEKECKNNRVGTVIHWELFKWLGFGHENTNF